LRLCRYRRTSPISSAAAVVAAADACVHVFSAGQGVDGTYLEYWQMCAEAGKVRYVGVCDLTPMSLDVNEAAAIAGRVLEEDVLVTTLPLLDDDESVIGVLDVVTGEQWFPRRGRPGSAGRLLAGRRGGDEHLVRRSGCVGTGTW
jgi:hypothetical protein